MTVLDHEDVLAALGGDRQFPSVGEMTEEELAEHLVTVHGQTHLGHPFGTRRHDYLRQVHFTQHAVTGKYGHHGARSFRPHIHVNTGGSNA